MYILPSSIHSSYYSSKSTMFNKEELMAMVEMLIQRSFKDEVLSYTVYEYDRNTEEIYS